MVKTSSGKRRLIRPLSLRRDSSQMPSLATLPVNNCTVLGDTIIPNNNSTGFPANASLDVCAVRQVVIQELENRVGLFLLQADNVTGNWARQCCSLAMQIW